jgi:FSR family fosmidomycin resistance protein-like MFS transporter
VNLFKTVPTAVLLVAAAHMVTDFSQGALLVALPYFKAKFGLSYTQVSLIALTQNLASSVIQPVFGYLSDRTPRPWLMAAGCLLSGLGTLASLLLTSYWLLVFSTALTGLGIAAFHPEGAKMVNRLSGEAKGKGVSMFVVGGNAGFAGGSLIMGLLLATGSDALLGLYIIPYLIIGWPLYRLAARLPSAIGKPAQALGNLVGMISLPLMALLGVTLVRATVSASIGAFIPLYYVSHLNGDPVYASWLLTTFLAGGAAGTLAGGVLSDKYGSKQVMLYSILPISVLLALFNISSGSVVFALLAVASALLSAAFAGCLVLTQRMMPRNVGMASGLTLGFSVGLGSMGVLALGRVADIWALPIVFDILAVLPVIGFILTLFVKEGEEVLNN